MKSVGPPAENGTSNVMGLDGQVSATAGVARTAAAIAVASAFISAMMSPCVFSMVAAALCKAGSYMRNTVFICGLS